MRSPAQLFIENLLNSVLSLFKVLILSKFFQKKDYSIDNRRMNCIILGNGPSLKKHLQQKIDWSRYDLFCVNYFPRTEEFEQLKPTYYVITSPKYYQREKNDQWNKDRLDTLKALNNKTTWPLVFYLPYQARQFADWKAQITNPNISIKYFNNTPVEGFRFFRDILFSMRLGMPRPHNVIIPCIYLATILKYDRVYLTGTDHSWLREIHVTPDNEVLLSFKHYYDNQTRDQSHNKNKPVPKPVYKGLDQEKRKLHEVLDKFLLSFQAYWILKDFAKIRNVEIINLVTDSYIDAFPKITIDEFIRS